MNFAACLTFRRELVGRLQQVHDAGVGGRVSGAGIEELGNRLLPHVANPGTVSRRQLLEYPIGIGDAWWWRLVAELVTRCLGERPSAERRALHLAIGSAARTALLEGRAVPATEAVAFANRFCPRLRWSATFAVYTVRRLPARDSEEWLQVLSMLIRGDRRWQDLVLMRYLWASYQTYVDPTRILMLPWASSVARTGARLTEVQGRLREAA